MPSQKTQTSPNSSSRTGTCSSRTGTFEHIPQDVLAHILNARLEEARQLVARRQELRLRVEEDAMRGRVEAANEVAFTIGYDIPQIIRCIRGPRDFEEFMRHWLQGQLDDGPDGEGLTVLEEWRDLAVAMDVPDPTKIFEEAQRHWRHCWEVHDPAMYPEPSSPLSPLSVHGDVIVNLRRQ